MKKLLNEILVPFGKPGNRATGFILVIWVVVILLLFEWLHNPIVPAPSKIAWAFLDLIQSGDFVDNFIQSLLLTLQAMGYSIFITMVLVYLSRIPLFGVFADFISKCRYLTLTGLVFLFTVLTDNVGQLKMSLLIFGIVPFFVTSFLSVLDRKEIQQQINKSYVNRRTRWETLYEVIIVGKLDELFDIMRQNFAVAWMMITTVEGYDMSGGGIGTLMIKSNKQMQLAPVFATLLMVLLTGIFFDFSLRKARYYLFQYIRKR